MERNEILKTTFIEQQTILGNALEIGDYKKSNKAMKKCESIFKVLECEPTFASDFLAEMLNNCNLDVQIGAAVFCLSLHIHIEPAIVILQMASRDVAHKVRAFDAQTTLKMWKQNGYIKVYSTQIIR